MAKLLRGTNFGVGDTEPPGDGPFRSLPGMTARSSKMQPYLILQQRHLVTSL
jgi:hypothetical protein